MCKIWFFFRIASVYEHECSFRCGSRTDLLVGETNSILLHYFLVLSCQIITLMAEVSSKSIVAEIFVSVPNIIAASTCYIKDGTPWPFILPFPLTLFNFLFACCVCLYIVNFCFIPLKTRLLDSIVHSPCGDGHHRLCLCLCHRRHRALLLLLSGKTLPPMMKRELTR